MAQNSLITARKLPVTVVPSSQLTTSRRLIRSQPVQNPDTRHFFVLHRLSGPTRDLQHSRTVHLYFM